MNGQPYTIIGVMPEGFAFPNNDKIVGSAADRSARDASAARDSSSRRSAS